MRVGIDASNLRAGGGVTHLFELLQAADPVLHNFQQVFVWGGTATLSRLVDRYWLCKVHDPLLDQSIPFRLYWQRFRLSRLADAVGCDVLFVPGGSYGGGFQPFVTMSRNMIPFEDKELSRYRLSPLYLRQQLLRRIQSATFRHADGLIFLTKYACNIVKPIAKISVQESRLRIIPHGVSDQFRHEPRPQLPLAEYSQRKPLKLVYISHFVRYKHQLEVVKAVNLLRNEGIPITINFVGGESNYFEPFRKFVSTIRNAKDFISYHGHVQYDKLYQVYLEADIFIFASSCENMPNTLVEAMASGLPIACSNRGPMPEILKDAGIYFDPESVDEIQEAIRILVLSNEKRTECAQKAYEYAKQYSWKRCARDTFQFLADVAGIEK